MSKINIQQNSNDVSPKDGLRKRVDQNSSNRYRIYKVTSHLLIEEIDEGNRFIVVPRIRIPEKNRDTSKGSTRVTLDIKYHYELVNIKVVVRRGG